MITRYHTETGSIYEVDDVAMKIRQLKRSEECASGRVAAEWRSYLYADVLMGRLAITWGSGRDEHSASADQYGTEGADDDQVTRMTQTSRVVLVDHVGATA